MDKTDNIVVVIMFILNFVVGVLIGHFYYKNEIEKEHYIYLDNIEYKCSKSK